MSGTYSIGGKRNDSRAVASALRDNEHDIASALEPLLFPDGMPEDLDIPTLLRALADLLERDGEALASRQADTGAGCKPAGQEAAPPAAAPTETDSDLAPDCSHEQYEARSQPQPETETPATQPAARAAASPEERVEGARQTLRHTLLRMRGLFGSLCGPHAPRRYGLDGRIPEEPPRLLIFARRAVRMLERAELGASQPTPFVTVDLAGAAACLRDSIEALEEALDAQRSPEPERPEAKEPEPGGAPGGAENGAHPRERARRWSPDVQAAASIAEGLLRLAHMDERADLVRALRSIRASAARRPPHQARGEAHTAASAEPPAA